ncbi:transglutaminase family protein [Pleionea sp. CnH1-48]|uniref:transglutaminase-like domain-containing protein n=1 Tax=Pleionea sp. CnH1-48 TaxID=2954494 RepID=UPI002096C3FC|nr:transglutaminase family protein [Pleionea sp. CnH1-48]MCO7223908.1 transglutaminase family protein [Pleionea sp. CnH1-48]
MLSPENSQRYLKETDFFNFSHPAVQELISQVKGDTDSDKAVSIYYLVRDSIRYNPYTVESGIASLKASFAIEKKEGYCIPKSALMVAMCRYFNIPARIGLADVKNHLSSPRMVEWLGTDYFAMHGYADVWLNDRWVKSTPVFNRDLCERYNVETLEFDGQNDAIFQSNSDDGTEYMEYLKEHGTFDDIPVQFIIEGFKQHYPHLVNSSLEKLTQ